MYQAGSARDASNTTGRHSSAYCAVSENRQHQEQRDRESSKAVQTLLHACVGHCDMSSTLALLCTRRA